MKLSYVDYGVPLTFCPHCGHKLDGVVGIDDDRAPKPNDPTICIYCYAWLVFTPGLGMRRMNSDDIAALDPELHTTLMRATERWRRVDEMRRKKSR